MAEQQNENSDSKLIGLMAQFDDPGSLVRACDQARLDGYKKMDAYSPFPVHGIDPAIGIRRTRLPFFVLAVGMGAALFALLLQWYANAADFFIIFPGYKFNIGGKPYWSLPANIPIVFEIIVLFSTFATFFGMWFLNRLPQFANPLLRISRFKRASNDRFFLVINEQDPQFDRAAIETKFDQWGATAIEEVRQDLTDRALPQFLKVAALMGAILLMIPPILIYRAMGMTNRAPRMHFMPDMDWQDKFKTQSISPNLANDKSGEDYLFHDYRAMRAQIPGTIARGDLGISLEYDHGIQAGAKAKTVSIPMLPLKQGIHVSVAEVAGEPKASEANGKLASAEPSPRQDQDQAEAPEAPPEPPWVTTFPKEVNIDAQTLARGRKRFEIYCSACHGYDGNGKGLINERALALNATGQAAWTAAKSLHDPEIKKNAVGRIFDTISNGRGTMGPYRRQIPTADRWAIVAYVKALQATGIEPETTAAVEAEKAADTNKP